MTPYELMRTAEKRKLTADALSSRHGTLNMLEGQAGIERGLSGSVMKPDDMSMGGDQVLSMMPAAGITGKIGRRLQRAKDQGFDIEKTWYRGTDRDYKRHKKDSFYSSDPKFAEQFTYGTGAIYPVHAKGKIFDFKKSDQMDDLIGKMDEIEARGDINKASYYPYQRKDVIEGIKKGTHHIESDLVRDALTSLGYDGTKLTETGVDNLWMFNPKGKIASKFDKFGGDTVGKRLMGKLKK
jgi:hypothetical protein